MVIAAKDGLDALQLLGERTPDAILLDIEMPRMDGFEFAKTIKADHNLADIPIIMITSRTAEKHRNRGRRARRRPVSRQALPGRRAAAQSARAARRPRRLIPESGRNQARRVDDAPSLLRSADAALTSAGGGVNWNSAAARSRQRRPGAAR